VLDPDAIQRTITAPADSTAKRRIAAGRAALRLQQQALSRGTSFAVETTLAGNTALQAHGSS
jgi:predicted ABC-type ATPase